LGKLWGTTAWVDERGGVQLGWEKGLCRKEKVTCSGILQSRWIWEIEDCFGKNVGVLRNRFSVGSETCSTFLKKRNHFEGEEKKDLCSPLGMNREYGITIGEYEGPQTSAET